MRQGDFNPPSVVLKDGDEYATEPTRIHELLMHAWRPFLHNAIVKVEPFLEEYAPEIQQARCTMEFPPISCDEFVKVLSSKNPRTKGGADGWLTAELQRLPKSVHARFLEFMSALENCASPGWPLGLCSVITVLLPKPDGSTRPISLVCAWLSAWMSVRYKHAKKLGFASGPSTAPWRSQGSERLDL